MFKCVIVLSIFFLVLPTCSSYHDGNDRVLLENVKAITLQQGHRTTGRRSSGVPQLKCVGGTAGCSAFTPVAVQCQNVGSDGFDAQWECKCDMDDSYRFGKIQVSCEGYDYPNDPYILKGSCGLEYTIDYTKAGRRENSYGGSNNYNTYVGKRSNSGGSWILFLLIVGLVVFFIYKMSATGVPQGDHPAPPPPPPSHHRPSSDGHGGSHDNSPPPYGFKPEYSDTRQPPPTYSDSTSGPNTANDHSSRTHTRTENQENAGPGFWGGMGLGGIAGYLFGSRNNRGYNRGYGGYGNNGYGYGNNGYGYGNNGYGYGNNGYGYGNNYGGGSAWGGSSWSGSGSSLGGSSARSRNNRPSSSRSTSGFSGTSRR